MKSQKLCNVFAPFVAAMFILLSMQAFAHERKGDNWAGARLYVDAAKADNTGDGTSWATAKKDIQAAINAAAAGDEIWVKEGTYYPTAIPTGLTATAPNAPVSDRDKTILLKDGLKLYGGFAGTETSLAQRLLGSRPTILDGDIGAAGDSTDNCYHLMVYLGSYTSTGVTIDGFTVRNGNGATYGPNPPPYDGSTLTIGGSVYGITRVYGGGIYLQQGVSNHINNVVFEKNHAKNRGFALFTDGGYGLYCSYKVTNCYFVNNFGTESSYGAWATNWGNNHGYNLVFHGNRMAVTGFGSGVALFLYDGVNRFINCSFTNNASISGSPVFLANGAKSYFSNCLFYGNTQSTLYNPGKPYPMDFFNGNFNGAFGKFVNCSLFKPQADFTGGDYTMAAGSGGNIYNQQPHFQNISSIKGIDGKYHTADDGLVYYGNSPCNNAGNNDSAAMVGLTDITGANRVQNGTVNIGAYEVTAAMPVVTAALHSQTNVSCFGGNNGTAKVIASNGTGPYSYSWSSGGTTDSVWGLQSGPHVCTVVDAANDTARVTVTIMEPLAVSAPFTANQIVCSGATVANLSATGTGIKWYSTATGGTALSAATLLADNTIYYASQTAGGCESPTRAADTVTVQTTAQPVVDTMQRFCGDVTISDLKATGTNIRWYVYSLFFGYAQIDSTTALNTATYYVSQTVNNCESVKMAVHVQVSLAPEVYNPGGGISCANTNTSLIEFESYDSVTHYNWTGTTTAIGLAASGTGNIAPFTTLNNTHHPLFDTITVTPTYVADTLVCIGASESFVIEVKPVATADAIANIFTANDSTVAAVLFNSPTTGGDVSYTWTNNNVAIGLAAGGADSVDAFTAVNTTNAPATATVSVVPTLSFSAGRRSRTCSGTPQAFTITVNPTPTITTVSNQVLCNGSTSNAMAFASPTTGGTVTYAWTNNKPSIGLAANGSGNLSSFTAVNNGTAPDTATITVVPTFTNGVSNSGAAMSFKIVINPTATLTALSNQIVCNGAATTAVSFGSPATGGAVNYTWTNNNPSIGLAASGTGNLASFNAINNGNTTIDGAVTAMPSFIHGGLSCPGESRNFTVTVNPTITVNAVSNQTLCAGSSSSAVAFGSNGTGGAISYVWTNNNTAIGLPASGSGFINSFTAANASASPQTATITVTPTYTFSGVACTGVAKTFTITVNPVVTVNAISNQVLCSGASSSAISFGSVETGGTVSYTWTNNNPAIGLAANGSGNIASFSAINNGNAPTVATITVTPTFTANGMSCAGTARLYTITVNPTVVITDVDDQVVCNNSGTGNVHFSSPATGGTIVYNWINSNPAIGLAATGTGDILSFQTNNNGAAPLSATITATATYTHAGLSCTSAPESFAFIINPTATITAVANKTACNNAPVAAVSFGSPTSGGSISYAWTNSHPSIGLAASGTGNISAFNAINASNAPVTATITVTPTFSNAGLSCSGTPSTFTITVNPTAVVNSINNQVVCASASTAAVNFSSPVAGTTYSWTNNNSSIGLSASGAGNIAVFVAMNTSPNAVNATVMVTPNTTAGCVGAAVPFTITVNGLSVAPTSIVNATPIVCDNNPVATLSVSGGALGTGAQWKWYADSLNTVSIGSGSVLSNITVLKNTTYFVRAEGTCNATVAASVPVQLARLVSQVRQHWSDVLLFDNSSRAFIKWQWYKNGAAVPGATLQQYSEGNALNGVYYVVATDRAGVQSTSCPMNITAGAFTSLRISLFPNPVNNGNTVTINSGFSATELQGATLVVADLFGRVVKQFAQVTPVMTMPAPPATGLYAVTLTLQNGKKYSANLLSN